MAGKPKRRIDYAGWSVDIFSNDIKIDQLLDAQGWVGFGIYFYLCQMAFGSNGYFYEWGYALCASTARKMGGGVGAGTVKETVDYCLQIGLFDKGLFDRWGVLTSKGIQNSYLVVLKSKNRKGTELIQDYWLLDTSKKEDYQGVVFVRKNSAELGENTDSLEENSHSLGENDHSRRQKESKGKDSKGKGIYIVPSKKDVTAYPYKEIIDYLNAKAGTNFKHSSADTQKHIRARCDNGFTLDDFKTVIDKKVSEWKGTDMAKYIRPSTLFGTKFEGYLNQLSGSGKKKNQFSISEQHDYDFDAIEKDLLGN